jgi:1,4-alpha-glucan branching enzyme
VRDERAFTERVMRQIATRPLPKLSGWRRLWRPRTVTIAPGRLLLVGAMAAALCAIFFAERRRAIPEPKVVEVQSETVLVRFALSAPDANRVSVAGDFNGWRPDAAPAERGADGIWRLTLPINRGSWSYSFVVDGKFVEDPLAEAWREDGFGGRNAIVRVN